MCSFELPDGGEERHRPANSSTSLRCIRGVFLGAFTRGVFVIGSSSPSAEVRATYQIKSFQAFSV